MTKTVTNRIEIIQRICADVAELQHRANNKQVDSTDAYAGHISKFLHKWSDEWYLLYLDGSKPDFFAPLIFTFCGRSSGQPEDLSDFLINGRVEIPKYSYDDNFNVNSGFEHSKVIRGFEPIIFSRATPSGQREISLSDQFIQTNDLFWDPETSCYFQLDEQGDHIPMVIVNDVDPLIICANQRVVQPYLSAKNKSLIRVWRINSGTCSQTAETSRSEDVFINESTSQSQKCLHLVFSDNSTMLCSDGGDIIKPQRSKKTLARQRWESPKKKGGSSGYVTE